MEYICFIASMASDQPIEFFKQLHPRNVARLKNKITDFSYFMRMPVGMLADTVKEVSRLGRQK